MSKLKIYNCTLYIGVVVGYYNDADTGEQGYAVETDKDHETSR